MKHMNILITGGAGFIGSHLIDSLFKDDPAMIITCIDNFDPFYDPATKKDNLKAHIKKSNFKLIKADIRNLSKLVAKLDKRFDAIIHLAAKVGVRPSVLDPISYSEVNIKGTQNMLELARKLNCKKFIFASSSSIYGINPNIPWKENDRLLLPVSPYAYSKISGEMLGSVYSHLFNMQFIALRLFTVYGPRQRPDLAIHKFTKLISESKPIEVYENGKSRRDYTYVDDVIEGFKSALNYSASQYEVINLGNNKPIKLSSLIARIEKILKKKAIIKNIPNQLGDLSQTFADISKASKLLNYKPKINLQDGLQQFVDWFYQNK